MKITINADIPQKSNDYAPDSISLSNDEFEHQYLLNIYLHSEEDGNSVSVALPMRELYFALKCIFEQEEANFKRDKEI